MKTPFEHIATLQTKPMSPGERNVSRKVLLLENLVKVPLFGCQRCGECILSSTAFVCSQQCPKKLRNGPCGGTRDGGGCEVYPDRTCVWYKIHKRSHLLGRFPMLFKYNRAHNWDLEGTSTWLNVVKKRINPPIWTVKSFEHLKKGSESHDT